MSRTILIDAKRFWLQDQDPPGSMVSVPLPSAGDFPGLAAVAAHSPLRLCQPLHLDHLPGCPLPSPGPGPSHAPQAACSRSSLSLGVLPSHTVALPPGILWFLYLLALCFIKPFVLSFLPLPPAASQLPRLPSPAVPGPGSSLLPSHPLFSFSWPSGLLLPARPPGPAFQSVSLSVPLKNPPRLIMEYYLAPKMKEGLMDAATRVKLENTAQ